MAEKNKNSKKKCVACGSVKSTSQFLKSSRSKDGFQQTCKVCEAKKIAKSKISEKRVLKKNKNDEITKKCSGCEKNKPQSAFSKDRTKKDGLYHLCKECRSVYRLKNKQEKKTIKKKKIVPKKNYHNNKDVGVLAIVKSGVAFGVCSVCGDTLMGYIPGYIQKEPVCRDCVIGNMKATFEVKKVKKKAS